MTNNRTSPKLNGRSASSFFALNNIQLHCAQIKTDACAKNFALFTYNVSVFIYL